MAAILGALIGKGIDAATQFGLAHYNNEYQGLLMQEDRHENYRYNEAAANNADIRTRNLYKDFYSPAALLRQYQEAGLSPSLMFGGTPGQGGMSGAQGSGAQGPTTPYHPVMMPGSLMESAMAAAQIEAVKAQTEKTKAETETIEGTRQPEIQKLLSEAGHNTAAAAAATASAEGMKLDNYIKEHTKDANIFTLCELADKTAYEATKMYNEMRSAKVMADLDEALYATNVQKGKEELNLLISSIKLNEQQQQYLRNEVLMSFETIMQRWKELDIKEAQQTTYTEWIEAQIPMLEKNLEVELKRLGIEKSKLVVNAITDAIKGIGTTAVALSMFKNGNRTTGPNELLKEHGYTPGGKAINQQKSFNNMKNNSIWAY